jgi:hypothetical protein
MKKSFFALTFITIAWPILLNAAMCGCESVPVNGVYNWYIYNVQGDPGSSDCCTSPPLANFYSYFVIKQTLRPDDTYSYQIEDYVTGVEGNAQDICCKNN